MKCKNCGKDVADNTVFCPFCHFNTFDENKSTNQEVNNVFTTKNNNFKEKIIIISISFLALMSVVILVYNICFVKSKPSGMTDQIYKSGCKIIELTDKYLDYEISKTEAYSKISDIDDRMRNNDTLSNLGVKIYTGAIEQSLSKLYPNDSEILEDRNNLAKELGLPSK